MKRLFAGLTILFLVIAPIFANNWLKVDLSTDDFDGHDELQNTSYYTLEKSKTCTYKGRNTSGNFTYVFGVDNESGNIHIRILEDGREKNLSATRGGTERIDTSTTFKISFKAKDGSKYSYDGGLVKVSTTHNSNRLSFYHDFRNFLHKITLAEVVITSDYGIYNLGVLDFTDLHAILTRRTYSIGDTGPSGGIIFYDCDADNASGNPDNLTSSTCGWQYLEAATEDVGQIPFGYYRPSGSNQLVVTSTGLGTGASNTTALVKAMGKEAYTKAKGEKKSASYAAKLCADYAVTHDGVTYDDWYLPSKDELDCMYHNLQESGLGNFEKSAYWSSSEFNGSNCWLQYFYSGYQYSYVRANKHYVRPIRTV